MRYLKKVPLEICIKLYWLVYIDLPDLEQSNFQKTDMIIFDIDFPATKTDMIKTEIKIAYVYDLAHASI
jgi:hypothetical protein